VAKGNTGLPVMEGIEANGNMGSMLSCFGKRRRSVPGEREHSVLLQSKNGITLSPSAPGLGSGVKIHFVGTAGTEFNAALRGKK